MSLTASKPTLDDDGQEFTGSDGDNSFAVEVVDKPDSKKELQIKVTPEQFGKTLEVVYKQLAPKVDISGFRPGKAPRNLVEAKLGARLFEETINKILPDTTAMALIKTGLNPLDYAKYSVTKVGKDDGLEYTATFTVMPEIKLPDFKKLNVKKDDPKVTKEETDEAFDRLKESILAQDATKSDDSKADTKGGQKDDTSKKIERKIDWADELKDDELKTEADVRKRMERIIIDRKASEVEEKYINDIVTESVKQAGIVAPHSLVHSEMDVMQRQYTERIEKLGLKLEDFLKTQQTDLETLQKDWHKDAEFKLSADLLFVEIAKKYEIKVAEEDVEKEIVKVTDEKVRKDYDTPQGKNYISSVLLRQKSVAKLVELVGGEK